MKRVPLPLLLAVLTPGCITPMYFYSDATGTGGATAGGGGAGGGATTASGMTSSSGTGGQANGLCMPGTTAPCYDGPAGTEGVGICKAGAKTCSADGTSYGGCVGEITPQAETCLTPFDDNCNGMVNEGGPGCVCAPNATMTCYTGPPGTLGVGICKSGTQTCNALGTGYGACAGEVAPKPFDDCATGVDQKCDGMSPKCTGNPLWSEAFGSASNGQALALAVDASGDIYVAGSFTGSLSFGGPTMTSAGGADLFLAKFTSSGFRLWNKRFGDATNQAALPMALAVDAAGNVLMTGTLLGTADFGGGPLVGAGNGGGVFTAKFDPSGKHLWSRRFGGGSYAGGSDIAVDAAGDVLVTGDFDGTVSFGGPPLTAAGGGDVFVAKLDVSGNHVWSFRFGDSESQYAKAIAVDQGGNVLLTGQFKGTVDFGGGPLTSAGDYDAFVAKLSPSGVHTWSKRYGDSGYQAGLTLAVDTGGNALMAGSFTGTIDFGGGPVMAAGNDTFVAKLDAAGSPAWSKHFGGASGSKLATDPSGNVVLTGIFAGTANFGGSPLTAAGFEDTFAAKLTGLGDHVWSKRFGSANQAVYAEAVAVDGNGSAFIAGEFSGKIAFGATTLLSPGGNALFLVRLAP